MALNTQIHRGNNGGRVFTAKSILVISHAPAKAAIYCTISRSHGNIRLLLNSPSGVNVAWYLTPIIDDVATYGGRVWKIEWNNLSSMGDMMGSGQMDDMQSQYRALH